MQRYPDYRDSGLPWTRNIPAHWDVIPLKFLVDINRETLGEDTPKEYELEYLDIGNVNEQGIIHPPPKMTFSNAPSRARRVTKKGDTLLSTVRTYLRAIAFLADTKENMVASTGFAVLTPNQDTCPEYLAYAVSGHNFINRVTAHSKGCNYPAITPAELGRLAIIVPPPPEQRAIVAYLNHKLALIDRYLANKQHLIELLHEQQHAHINHAVMRGLDPTAPLKPSGVAWLGDIPAGWEIKPIWALFTLGRGRVISKYDIGKHPGIYPVYSSQTEHEGVMGYIDSYDFEGEHITWTTDGAYAGTVFYRTGKFNCTNVCGTLYPKQTNVELRFIRHALAMSTHYYVRQDINPKLMNNVMARIKIPLPPLEEQIRIADYLDNKQQEISKGISHTQQEIALMHEYRTTLIANVVTGKMDVQTISLNMPLT